VSPWPASSARRGADPSFRLVPRRRGGVISLPPAVPSTTWSTAHECRLPAGSSSWRPSPLRLVTISRNARRRARQPQRAPLSITVLTIVCGVAGPCRVVCNLNRGNLVPSEDAVGSPLVLLLVVAWTLCLGKTLIRPLHVRHRGQPRGGRRAGIRVQWIRTSPSPCRPSPPASRAVLRLRLGRSPSATTVELRPYAIAAAVIGGASLFGATQGGPRAARGRPHRRGGQRLP